MRNRIIVHVEEYECPICTKEFEEREKAEKCLKAHLDACRKVLPKYKINGHVLTHYLDDSDYGEQTTTIIDIKGELFDMELLVENERRERYWVKPVCFQNVNLQQNPTDFRIDVPLVHKKSFSK